MATEQVRLLWAAMLVALPLACGYRFARRFSTPAAAAADAILIAGLIQYACVGAAGLVGMLSPAFLTAEALVFCAVLWIGTGCVTPVSIPPATTARERRIVFAICLGAMGMMAALVFSQRLFPPLATDAITYHLPAAVVWLQEKRISLFQTWFFNPANTYSPLAGSMFAAWLMAPMGNDALARFVQVMPWALILFSLMTLCRDCGAPSMAAALAAVGAVLSRPFLSESILAKDDLFVAAFFISAVAGLSRGRISGRFAAARVGIAIGLMLATKYTALMSLPILLLAVDAPLRAKWQWRHWTVAACAVLIIAGPWYVRNLIRWGNPLFPIRINLLGWRLPGLLPPIHVPELRTAGGLWTVITGGYYSLRPILLILLSASLLITMKQLLVRDPVIRMIVLGPPLGILIFAMCSPQPEVRFLLPAFVLLFASCAIALPRCWSIALSATVTVVAITTSFSAGNAGRITHLAMWGVAVALIGTLLRRIEIDALRLRRPILTVLAAIVVFAAIIFHWNAYLSDYRDSRMAVWQSIYPGPGEMWNFASDHIPADVTIAYSNQFMIYPLYGFDQQRNVVYAPVRRGATVSTLTIATNANETDLNELATRAANVNADLAAWRENLRSTGAQYLVIGNQTNAPEFAWASVDSADFQKIFQNSAAAIFRIIPKSPNLR